MVASFADAQKASAPPEKLRVEVVRSYPHDRAAFTQGLLLHGGKLYESTGLVGQSSLREVEIETGRVIRRTNVPPPIFAEGLALVGNRLIQLTWQNGRALIYDRQTFIKQGELSYRGEGWGLSTAG
ncbi:MAG: glutaminyl-peptide cyclotransferase, partial [Vicinamibacterales bacterium]